MADLGAIAGSSTVGTTGGGTASGGSTPVSDTITRVQLVVGQSMYKYVPDTVAATFPAAARLLTEGYKQSRESGVDRSSVEDGMTVQLRRKSRTLVTRTVKYQFDTQSDFDAFIDWYENTINNGADWFNWTDPVDRRTKLARIVGGNLNDEEPISGVPNLGWRVSLSIETWNR